MQSDEFEDKGGKPAWIKDPDSGQVLAIERWDPRYSEAVRSFWSAECAHDQIEIRRVLVSGGHVQVRKCCTNCGEGVGQALGQKDVAWVATLPLHDTIHKESYKERRRRNYEEMLLRIARVQEKERGKFTRQYKDYLSSPEWHQKRQLVIKRCGNVCEGCGLKGVLDVHHTTYWHFGNEFLFELLGLCNECHDRLHVEKEPMADLDANSIDELDDSEPF